MGPTDQVKRRRSAARWRAETLNISLVERLAGLVNDRRARRAREVTNGSMCVSTHSCHYSLRPRLWSHTAGNDLASRLFIEPTFITSSCPFSVTGWCRRNLITGFLSGTDSPPRFEIIIFPL